MTRPLISVVIPAYRAARTIVRPIRSLLNQIRRPDEILVVDDGSPDGIAEALTPFDSAVTLLRKPNGGAASARNFGIEHSRGDLIAFLDADDAWEPSKLESQLAVLNRHPEVGVVGCRWHETPPVGSPSLAKVTNPEYYGRVLRASGPEAFRIAMCMSTSSLLVRREALGTERFDTSLETAEDRDLWVRLVSANPVYLMPEPLVKVVLEPASLSRTNLDRDCRNMLRVIQRHARLLTQRETRNQESIVYRRWAGGHLGDGHFFAAIKPACHRLKRGPFSIEGWWVLFKSLTGACCGVVVKAQAQGPPS